MVEKRGDQCTSVLLGCCTRDKRSHYDFKRVTAPSKLFSRSLGDKSVVTFMETLMQIMEHAITISSDNRLFANKWKVPIHVVYHYQINLFV